MRFLDRFKRKSSPPSASETPSAPPDALQEPAPAESAPEIDPDELRLELGDFLHRIPAHLLNPGPHDPKTEIYFSISDLSQRIARGETTVELLTIYKQAPQIFRSEVRASDNLQVRFPWQRLAVLVKQTTSTAATDSVDTGAATLLQELRAQMPATTSRHHTSPEDNERSEDLLRKTTAERDAALESVARLQREIGELRNSSHLEAITAERDALLQQKAHLSRQISDLSRRGQGSALLSTSAAAQQRQVEEFQRRIAMMESAQRDTALELTREKEARAKAEKLLAAADKLQEQSANYMANARTEIRREVECSLKAREIESRKVQKDLQDQLAALSELYRKACLDLDEARILLAGAQPQTETSSGASQNEAIGQLEAEIESYRRQLETLVAERDEALENAKNIGPDPKAEESEAARAQLTEEVQRLKTEHAAAIAAMEAERTKYEGMFADFEKEHTAVVRSKEDLTQRLAESERARRTLEKDQAKAAKSDVGLLGDPTLQAELAGAREKIAQLEQDLANVRVAESDGSNGLSPDRARHLAQKEQDERTALQRELARMQAERDNLILERDELLLRIAEDGQKKASATQLQQGELLPTNIIEVTEILPPDGEKNVRLPRVRATAVRPPKLRNP